MFHRESGDCNNFIYCCGATGPVSDWTGTCGEVGLSHVPVNRTGNQIVTDAAYVEVQEVIHGSSEKDCQGRRDTNRLKENSVGKANKTQSQKNLMVGMETSIMWAQTTARLLQWLYGEFDQTFRLRSSKKTARLLHVKGTVHPKVNAQSLTIHSRVDGHRSGFCVRKTLLELHSVAAIFNNWGEWRFDMKPLTLRWKPWC